MADSARTAGLIKGMSNDDIDCFFMVSPNLDDGDDFDDPTSDGYNEYWDYQLEDYYGADCFKYDWDYEMLNRCYKELQRKTYKQRIDRYLHIANDNGWQKAHRSWRKQVHERCGYACAHCGTNKNLHAHHIKPRAQYPELQFDPDNGITLCKACHEKVHREMKGLESN